MYIPSRFNFLEDSLLDDCKKSPIMNTDIIEKKDGYELQIDLPGVKKEVIQIEMDKGILSISVSISNSSDEEDKKYIRKERFTGEIKRSFNIGENVDEEEEKDNKKKYIEIN